MNNFIPPDPKDPQVRLQSNLERRKKIQEANKLEETNSMMDMKQKIMEIEGQEMREIMQVFCLLPFQSTESLSPWNI
jgi:hypothetical protein